MFIYCIGFEKKKELTINTYRNRLVKIKKYKEI